MNVIDQLIGYLRPLGQLDGVDVAPLERWFRDETTRGEPAVDPIDGRPVVDLATARALVTALAPHESLLVMSPPGVGKTELVAQAARAAGLPCRSVLGTQLAPEDLTGLPRIEGERTVFYPPRAVLPDGDAPFCLFLDELPAAAPDVQKAMYSLLLERRLGERRLPAGSWVVAAGNRAGDRALARPLSTALVNRVFVVHVRPGAREWQAWAEAAGVRDEVRRFLACSPEALLREPPDDDGPFSTPRAWASLAAALDHAERAGVLDGDVRRALAHGRVSPEDADAFCAACEHAATPGDPTVYLEVPDLVPDRGARRWHALAAVRDAVRRGGGRRVPPPRARRFLERVSAEERSFLLDGAVPAWGALAGAGALRALVLRYLRELGPAASDEVAAEAWS